MHTVAILPIKSFGAAKQRLAEELPADARRSLAEAMFTDVLLALARTNSIEMVLVVTADQAAQRIAHSHEVASQCGAVVLSDHDHGHNPAARRGIRAAIEAGAQRAILLPGDCPMLDPAQLERLLARPFASRSALIVPDRHGTGTNALLLTPPESLQPSFGPGSCRRHAADARAQGTIAEVVEVPSLALDVDTAEDLEALREQLEATEGGAGQTRAVLAQLMRTRI